ncbi:DUF2975 domain-containing protein [Micromonosporaceae bacterium Da 78-11]
MGQRHMGQWHPGKWLRQLRTTTTVVAVVAACLAVALLVIALIPGSPVSADLPTSLLSGLDGTGGIKPGVVVDPEGWVAFEVADPSLAQRLLHLATTLPGLLLVAEIARRLAAVLRAAQDSDPFTERTVHDLTLAAKITAFGGVGVWAVGVVAKWTLSATMLGSGAAVEMQDPLFGWLAVALIFAAFAQLVAHGVSMRAELDTVI